MFAPMAIPAVALQQQHDARRDILIEPAARRHAAIEAWGILNWGRNWTVKTNRLVVHFCRFSIFWFSLYYYFVLFAFVALGLVFSVLCQEIG